MKTVMVRAADEPNLPAARRFTRELGPAALASGVLILFNGIVLIALESPYSSWLAAPYGLLLAAFGAAAYVRTETALGKVLRWMVVAIFSFGGCYALLQWAQLIWGSRAHALEGDLMLMGLYLMAGPALLVPAGLALARGRSGGGRLDGCRSSLYRQLLHWQVPALLVTERCLY